MNSCFWRARLRVPTVLAALATLGLLTMALPGASPAGDDLEELLEDVGEDYARAYASPLLYSFGPNLNSALYSTASIPQSRLTFGFGLKVMGTRLHEDDQAFRKVIDDVDLGSFDSNLAGQTGRIVLSGPTVFGDPDTFGRIEGYVGGVKVVDEEGIEGLVDTRWSPLAAPEISVGGIGGLKATIRYLPEMDLGDVGKTKFFGYGLQWNANGMMPTLPLDVMVGFFKQDLDIGTVVEAEASSMFLAASKDFALATLYGGFAIESSDMTITYNYSDSGEEISFDVEGRQDNRITVGATLNVLAKLNVEMGHGEVTTYSAGLLFGF